MKLDTSAVVTKIEPALMFAKRYAVFIFVVAFLGTYVYLVQYIGKLIQTEPSQSAVESQTKPVSRLKIDQGAVDQMKQLEAQNIEVQSLFDQARENPFTEE